MREEDSVEREEMVQAYTGCGSVYNVPFTQSVILQRLREKRDSTREHTQWLTYYKYSPSTDYQVQSVCSVWKDTVLQAGSIVGGGGGA